MFDSDEVGVGENLYSTTQQAIQSITRDNINNYHFNNASINRFQGMLEALALNESDVPEVIDDLDNYKLLNDNQQINKLKDMMGLDKKSKGNKVVSKSNVNKGDTATIK